MPMTRRCASVLGEPDDHAGLGRAGDRADDEESKAKPSSALLGAHFFGETDIAEPAEFVDAGAGWNGVGTPALLFDLLQRIFPTRADADVETFVDEPHVGAHDAAQLDVTDAVVDGVLVGNPGLLHQPALHADLGGDGGHHAGVVRLHAADRDQRVGVRGDARPARYIRVCVSCCRRMRDRNCSPPAWRRFRPRRPRCWVRRESFSIGVGPKVRG